MNHKNIYLTIACVCSTFALSLSASTCSMSSTSSATSSLAPNDSATEFETDEMPANNGFGLQVDQQVMAVLVKKFGNNFAAGLKPRIIEALNAGLKNGEKKIIRVLYKSTMYVITIVCCIGLVVLIAKGEGAGSLGHTICFFGTLFALLEAQNKLIPTAKRLFNAVVNNGAAKNALRAQNKKRAKNTKPA